VATGISGRQLAKELGLSEAAVRKAARAGRIKPLADGSFDADACRQAWGKATDPARTKVREPAHQGTRTPVRTAEEAEAAVALIARVLTAEGITYSGEVDYNAARTADTILKAYERDLKIAQRRRELVPIASVKEHVGRSFIGLRQAIQRIPSRHVPAIAAELGCDPAALDAALTKAIAIELDALSAPVVRA